jgi:hypothetical protein
MTKPRTLRVSQPKDVLRNDIELVRLHPPPPGSVSTALSVYHRRAVSEKRAMAEVFVVADEAEVFTCVV